MMSTIDFDFLLELAEAEADKYLDENVILRNFWSKEELAFVEENLGPLSLPEIAQALGRSVDAVKIKQVRLGFAPVSKRPGWLTSNQASKKLGMDIHSMMRLYQRGLIPLETVTSIERTFFVIKEVTLRRWAVNPNHWMYFKVARMTDEDLQRLVIRAQEEWGDEWLIIGEAARLIGYENDSGLNQRIHMGSVPAVKWGNWWVRRSDAEAFAAVVAFGKGGVKRAAALEITRLDRWLCYAKFELGKTHDEITRTIPGANKSKSRNRIEFLRREFGNDFLVALAADEKQRRMNGI